MRECEWSMSYNTPPSSFEFFGIDEGDLIEENYFEEYEDYCLEDDLFYEMIDKFYKEEEKIKKELKELGVIL